MGNVIPIRPLESKPGDNNTAKSCLNKEELLRRMDREMKLKHFRPSTLDSYSGYVKEFIEYRQLTGTKAQREGAMKEFLTYLAVEKKVSASTQNVALNALKFFYEKVVGIEIDVAKIKAVRAKTRKRLPVILTSEEVFAVLDKLPGAHWLICSLLYGAGLRIEIDCLTLRVQDIDFGQELIILRDSKGEKSRALPLPKSVIPRLKLHLEDVKKQHDRDLAQGWGSVALPNALERKYPKAAKSWSWQWVFPATSRYFDPKLKIQRRHHLHPSAVSKVFSEALREAGIYKHATPHTLRHCYATHQLESGVNVRVVQELMGHASLETTMIYTHVTRTKAREIPNPLDRLMVMAG